MTIRITSRVVVTGIAVAAALAMTACGDDTAEPAAKSTSTPPSKDCPPPPTVADLQAMLAKGLDTSIPSAEKTDFVQGGEADPELFDKVAAQAKTAQFTVDFTDITDQCGTATANGTFTLNGQANPGQVPFVYEAGKWKLEKTWVCSLLVQFNVQSPAC